LSRILRLFSALLTVEVSQFYCFHGMILDSYGRIL
jgi:hypothetical protein